MSEIKTKFDNKFTTAKGDKRAKVDLKTLKTLWFNTGTLCNLKCENCYIESSPTNDRLSYLTNTDVVKYLEEIKEEKLPTKNIGITGGEPFLNPHIIPIINSILEYDHELLILTNANRVIKRHQDELIKIKNLHGEKLKLRISLDHFTPEIHDQERGEGAFQKTIDQMKWLCDQGFEVSIASRSLVDETQEDSIQGHEKMLIDNGIKLNLKDKIVVFPEMKSNKDVPEITTACWDILNVSPDNQMCASERMIIKRKGEDTPVIMPCTLLAYDEQFILGKNLKDAKKEVYLNHPFCAEFCVLGGASCSSTS
jgi:molybdenum cofactor biosynthesis enzyme MoaA